MSRPRPCLVLIFAALAAGAVSCSKDAAPAPAATPPAASDAATATAGATTPPAAAGPAAPRAVAAAGASARNEPLASMEWPNLVLITMEATRPDHLGCYDDSRAKTPALDQLAREGAVFEQAVVTAPLTLPSHASILTGLYPPRHGVRDNTGAALADSQTTLAEHLKVQGYATAASVGTQRLGRETGLMQGFDSYDQPKKGSRSAALGAGPSAATARAPVTSQNAASSSWHCSQPARWRSYTSRSAGSRASSA